LKRRLLALWMIACAATATPAIAQLSGSRPVRLIVTSVPGGPSDFVARIIAPGLAEALGRNVVVDSRGSVGGILAAELAARAAPDGATLIVGNSGSHAINASLYRKLPYDAERDFAPVSQLVSASMVFVANPRVPANNMAEFIAAAKKEPGKYNVAIAGSTGEIAGEALMARTGIKLTNVPYKGSSPAQIAVLSGEADVSLITVLASAPHVNAGRLKAFGLTGIRRSPLLPNVPTLDEAGVPGYAIDMWHGLLAPAGTPRPLVRTLHADIVKVLAKPEVRDRFLTQGFEPVGSTPEAFGQLIRDETEKYRKIIRDAGIQPQ
jgi:tripartite-type tricarboxylate transporter receptor subunit TctC